MHEKTLGDDQSNTLRAALAWLNDLLMDGLDHGFFDCIITCELVSERKRRLVIKAGKSHQFTIPEDELRRR